MAMCAYALDISIHAPRVGGDPASTTWTSIRGRFQSTPPVWGATRDMQLLNAGIIFQSTPPVWGATGRLTTLEASVKFQSTPPVWGATLHAAHPEVPELFQSTPPVWGATSNHCFRAENPTFQSTPPVWGATVLPKQEPLATYISIHAPRVGGDLHLDGHLGLEQHFNPRPPCGGRPDASRPRHPPPDFNPRPPCGGRREPIFHADEEEGISIHAPRVGGDFSMKARYEAAEEFQSTPPVWGATCAVTGDRNVTLHFNPRPPCGGRPGSMPSLPSEKAIFQSTPPVWGATIQSRLPPINRRYFNPRPPCGGRRIVLFFLLRFLGISIHAPRVGGDSKNS